MITSTETAIGSFHSAVSIWAEEMEAHIVARDAEDRRSGVLRSDCHHSSNRRNLLLGAVLSVVTSRGISGPITEETAMAADRNIKNRYASQRGRQAAERYSGKSGRIRPRFRVVADEVRKLAERSLAETKSISDLIARSGPRSRRTVKAIQTSVREVEAGSSIAHRAGVSLDAIMGGSFGDPGCGRGSGKSDA